MIANSLLADSSGFDHMTGFGWGMSIVWVTLGLSLVIGLAWAVLASTGREKGRPGQADDRMPADILAGRFARGEIDEDEFRSKWAVLGDVVPPV